MDNENIKNLRNIKINWNSSFILHIFRVNPKYVLIKQSPVKLKMTVFGKLVEREENLSAFSLRGKTVVELQELLDRFSDISPEGHFQPNSILFISNEDYNKIEHLKRVLNGEIAENPDYGEVTIKYKRKEYVPKIGLFVKCWLPGTRNTFVNVGEIYTINTKPIKVATNSEYEIEIDVDYECKITNPEKFVTSGNNPANIENIIGERLDKVVRNYFGGKSYDDVVGTTPRNMLEIMLSEPAFRCELDSIEEEFGITITRATYKYNQSKEISEAKNRQKEAEINNETARIKQAGELARQREAYQQQMDQLKQKIDILKAKGWPDMAIAYYLKDNGNSVLLNGAGFPGMFGNNNGSQGDPNNNGPQGGPNNNRVSEQRLREYKDAGVCDDAGILDPTKADKIYTDRGIDPIVVLKVWDLTEAELSTLDEKCREIRNSRIIL